MLYVEGGGKQTYTLCASLVLLCILHFPSGFTYKSQEERHSCEELHERRAKHHVLLNTGFCVAAQGTAHGAILIS
jgi:hypothetical protein